MCISITANVPPCISLSVVLPRCIDIYTNGGEYDKPYDDDNNNGVILEGYFTTFYMDNSGSMIVQSSTVLPNGNTLLNVVSWANSQNLPTGYIHHQFEVDDGIAIIYSDVDICPWLNTIVRAEASVVFLDSNDPDNNCTPYDSVDVSHLPEGYYKVTSDGVYS